MRPMEAQSNMKYSREDIWDSIKRVNPEGLNLRSKAFKKSLVRLNFLMTQLDFLVIEHTLLCHACAWTRSTIMFIIITYQASL